MKVTEKNRILNFIADHQGAYSHLVAARLGISLTYVRMSLLDLFRGGFVRRYKREHSRVRQSYIYTYYLTKRGRKKVEFLRSNGYL